MLAALVAGLLLGAAGCRPAGPTGPAGGGMGMEMPVVAMAAERRPVTESVSLVGTLAANEEVEVKSETDGAVVSVAFEEGQEVEQGALLVQLDDTKLSAELADAEARLKLSAASFARVRQLFEDRLISQQEYDQAASTYEVGQATVALRRRLLQDARLHAPFRGRTGARNVSPGQVISRNTVITWLVDLDPMKVEMYVPERFLGQTRLGQRVRFEVTAYPGQPFEGEIYFIAPRLDLVTRTALVKTRIPNADGRLKAGMVANLELKLTVLEDAVVVPEAALLSNGDRYFVFVVNGDQTLAMRPVAAGLRMPRWVAVASGLEAGELVVVEGHQKVGPGMKVSLAPPEKAAPYRSLEGRSGAPAGTDAGGS